MISKKEKTVKAIKRKKNYDTPGTTLIALRMDDDLLSKLKDTAKKENIGYQKLIKKIIRNYFSKE